MWKKNLSKTNFEVLQFKDTYEDKQLDKNKTLRMQLWAPNRIYPLAFKCICSYPNVLPFLCCFFTCCIKQHDL